MFFKLFPLFLTALLSIAHKEYQAGNYAKAEQHCLALLQQNLHNIGVLLLLSSIAFQQIQMLLML